MACDLTCFALLVLSVPLIFQGITAERFDLTSYDEVIDALHGGNDVHVVLNTAECGVEGDAAEPQILNIPMDVWGEIEGNFNVKFLKFSNFQLSSGKFDDLYEGVVTMYEGTMNPNGEILFELLTTRPTANWQLLASTRVNCSFGFEGVSAIGHRPGPRLALSSYEEIKEQLLAGNAVSVTHSLNSCENFDGTTYRDLRTGAPADVFYVYRQGDQELIKVVSRWSLFRNTLGSGSEYGVYITHTNLYADGSVTVKPGFWDTIEWDNEFGQSGGSTEVMEFHCQMGPEKTSFWAPADVEFDSFSTYDDVLRELMGGNELQLILNSTSCFISSSTTSDDIPLVILGAPVGAWQLMQNGSVLFSSYHVTEQGIVHFESYALNPDDSMRLILREFVYIGGITVLDVEVTCDSLSEAGKFVSKHLNARIDLDTMDALEDEVLRAGRPSVVIDYENCDEVGLGTGADLAAGFPAKFTSIVFTEEPGERIFKANGLALSDNFVSEEGYAYVAVSLGVGERGSEVQGIVDHALIDGDNFQDMWTQPQSVCNVANEDPERKSVYIWG